MISLNINLIIMFLYRKLKIEKYIKKHTHKKKTRNFIILCKMFIILIYFPTYLSNYKEQFYSIFKDFFFEQLKI